MAQKKVKKNNPGKQVADAVASLKDLDKNISKAMKNMSASINITLSSNSPAPKKKKKVKKK